MAWVTCQHTREEINIAGRKLIQLEPSDPEREDALEIINNWRSCHTYPLHIIAKTLHTRAKTKVNQSTLVARRIKRLSSISLKLRHNPEMKLTQMQDIGGCRAVVANVSEVDRLVKVCEDAQKKRPHSFDRPVLVKKDDYIREPKGDGYRSVHLIMKYHSAAKPEFEGQKIEIQIRSKLQHAWATAVETCQTFTGQALKSRIKNASSNWLEFFALMSSAIAAREKMPLVPETPRDKKERKERLKKLEGDERIIPLLTGWSSAIRREEAAAADSAAYLLQLDTAKREFKMWSFTEDHMHRAQETYLDLEKQTETNPDIQVVLVSAESVAALRRAYPNYYVDTTAFILAVKQEIY
jgi:ppGpp synthetase/RelA/SpoT-type nucleotidyltranferase